MISASGVWHEQLVDAKGPLSRTILPGADGSLYIFTNATGVPPAFEVPKPPELGAYDNTGGLRSHSIPAAEIKHVWQMHVIATLVRCILRCKALNG